MCGMNIDLQLVFVGFYLGFSEVRPVILVTVWNYFPGGCCAFDPSFG